MPDATTTDPRLPTDLKLILTALTLVSIALVLAIGMMIGKYALAGDTDPAPRPAACRSVEARYLLIDTGTQSPADDPVRSVDVAALDTLIEETADTLPDIDGDPRPYQRLLTTAGELRTLSERALDRGWYDGTSPLEMDLIGAAADFAVAGDAVAAACR